MDTAKQSCIIFFMKYPEPGQVKTRLGHAIGQQQAAELYACFVEDIVDLLIEKNIPTICCYEPDSARASIEAWLGPRHHYVAQAGTTLGERMENAFTQSFKLGFSRAIVIGTDIPDLPATHLHEALEAVKSHDCVIGPATDGGYYLIGLPAVTFVPAIFQDITWSTSTVYAETMATLHGHHLKPHILPTWHDVDTYADLCELIERNANTSFATSKTYQTVLQNGWQRHHRG